MLNSIPMKINIKNIAACVIATGALTALSSCNDLLDMEPITQITPQDYYKNADQLAAYLNNYYNGQLTNPFSGVMFHQATYTDGMNRSDVNTDIACVGGGNLTLYAPNHWQTGTGKSLQTYYGDVRVWNHFRNTAQANYARNAIQGEDALVRNYIGEGHFFRALAYFRILALYGDAPIVTTVIPDQNDVIVENSIRSPRNEVARFILADLDTAITMLSDRSRFNGQRVCREAAQLLKSRVALFEGTFEKYHKGSGRVPGDAEWPGAAMSYNAGKTFNIDNEVNFFLTQAMEATKAAVGSSTLTVNNRVLQPELGQISGWNPYFEMYSQKSLAGSEEVLLWKEYDAGVNVKHSAPFRSTTGCNDGMTRAFVEGFLMTDGKPFYASDLYRGDKSLDDVKANRDYRLQLFLWGESTLLRADSKYGDALGTLFGAPPITSSVVETRAITGYMSRKYVTYDQTQCDNDQILGVNACPIFRTAEAMLNYMEACVEKTGSVDGTAADYWRQLRRRAGVDEDFNATISATDLNKELQWSVYSGTTMVSSLIFNVRRERVAETFNEGLRFMDLIRWRSFDRMLTDKWIPEGCNFWDEMHVAYEGNGPILADGSPSSTVSGPSQSKYLRPYSANMASTNELLNGYSWREAYYLYPLGAVDLTSASPTRKPEDSNLYQNIHWPMTGGRYAEK